MTSELESDLQDTVDWGRKWFIDFNAGKLNWFCLTSLITSDNDVKTDGSVFEEKSSFKMLGLTFSSNWIRVVTLSLLLKLPPWKLEL